MCSIILCLVSCSSNRGEATDEVVAQVDSLLNKTIEFNGAKELELATLRHNRDIAKTPADRYKINEKLYKGYFSYQSDSALKYIDENLELATKMNNEQEIIRCKIDKSELLAGSGLLSNSIDVMNSLDRASIPDSLLVDYYGQMVFLYSHMGNYAGGDDNGFYVLEKLYKDSVANIITPDNDEYLWYKGMQILGTDKPADKLIAELNKKLKNAKFNTHQNAKDAYILARLYEQTGDRESHKKFLALSAMADIRIANAEIASLQELAEIYFDEGDIDHAYEYIKYSLNKALAYPNRVKALGIASTMDKVYNAYQKKNAKLYNRTRYFLIAVCVLVIILIIVVIINRRQNIKLHRSRRELDEINKALSENNRKQEEANDALTKHMEELSRSKSERDELISNLRAANEHNKEISATLREANFVKEECIGATFALCSTYITRLENYRNNISKLARAQKWKDLEKEVIAASRVNRELKEFYHSFDTLFLNIYPDFVSDFNELLRPEERVSVPDGTLNTELRIYALVRLGVSDSVKIAKLLQCSPQTVYNYRLRMRNKALVHKENFANAVKSLGKFNH
ncbi:MAG: DUF6377 domain-containing protein [Muribaculaceae bacterium]|nr:DUF6377 domain-containing protein [Muribaculaceae bacterium]